MYAVLINNNIRYAVYIAFIFILGLLRSCASINLFLSLPLSLSTFYLSMLGFIIYFELSFAFNENYLMGGEKPLFRLSQVLYYVFFAAKFLKDRYSYIPSVSPNF